jgi:hypothetical protein
MPHRCRECTCRANPDISCKLFSYRAANVRETDPGSDPRNPGVLRTNTMPADSLDQFCPRTKRGIPAILAPCPAASLAGKTLLIQSLKSERPAAAATCSRLATKPVLGLVAQEPGNIKADATQTPVRQKLFIICYSIGYRRHDGTGAADILNRTFLSPGPRLHCSEANNDSKPCAARLCRLQIFRGTLQCTSSRGWHAPSWRRARS